MGIGRNRTESILGDPRRTLLSMALPMLLAILVENLQTFVDGMWCSGLGTEALSAISISSCIYTMIVALGTGMAVGASASISKSIGAGDMRSAENAVPAIIAIILGMSVLSSIAFWFLAEPIVHFIGQGQDIETCMEYIRPFLVMSFFLMMNSVWVGILRAE